MVFVYSFGLQIAKLLRFIDSQEFRETPRERIIEKSPGKKAKGTEG